MKALIKEKNGVFLRNIPQEPLENGFVKIKVCYIGLCRTDLFVASGKIPRDFDLILGHEFSGIIVESKSNRLKINDKVSINPFFKDKGFLGLDFNGCIQEYISIPANQILVNNLPLKVSAYLEPVAASMAVLKICKNKTIKGAIWGKNRIAELTYIILKKEGFNIDIIDENSNLIENSYSYIIETMFDENILKNIIKLLKPKGTLIIKSRKTQPTSLIPSDLVAKELNLRCVNYYSFKKSLHWIEKNYHLIEHLLGQSYFIDDWEKAFKEAEISESKKIFINF